MLVRCAILRFGFIAQNAAEHILGCSKMKRLLFQIILLAGCVTFAGGQTPPDLQERIQTHMGEYLAHLPNYTCRVTIARSSRPGPDRNFQLTDRIRLEVEFAGGQELYSWPGEDRFEHGLEKLVGGIPGLISIGSYALLTRALFTTDAAEFGSPREAACEGKPCLELDFKVPVERTDYVISDEQQSAPAAYSGTIWFDRDTLNQRQVRMRADQVPPRVKIASAQEATVYTSVRIGNSDVVLPSSTETISTRRDGSQNRNVATFENCRRFAGESTISFDEAPGDAPSVQAVRDVRLPESFDLEIALDAPIGSGAAIGDLFTGTVRQIKSNPPSNIPASARVTGRITNMLYIGFLRFNFVESMNYESWFLAVKLLKIEWPGGGAAITGMLRNIREISPVLLIRRPSPNLAAITKKFGFPNEMLLRVADKEVKIPAGFRMTWRAEKSP
jgi:hypothetical protein